MNKLILIQDLESDSSDSEEELSDFEQDEDIIMITTDKFQQATCAKPLPLFKIEQITPVASERSLTSTLLLTTTTKSQTPAPPVPTYTTFKDPFANVVFMNDSESSDEDEEEDAIMINHSAEETKTQGKLRVRDKSWNSDKTECSSQAKNSPLNQKEDNELIIARLESSPDLITTNAKSFSLHFVI